MKLRIGMWASVGAFVVLCWTLYLAEQHPTPLTWTLVCLTCPIALAREHVLSVYLVLLANICTYALFGLVVETVKRQRRLLTH